MSKRMVLTERAVILYNEALKAMREGGGAPGRLAEGLQSELAQLKAILSERRRVLVRMRARAQLGRADAGDLQRLAEEVEMREGGIRLLEDMLRRLKTWKWQAKGIEAV